MSDTRISVESSVLDEKRVRLLDQYLQVRRFTETLTEGLLPEDCVIQSMPDASPTRWHLAHVTWFFETFVLSRALNDYAPFHPHFVYLFNSYYNQVGDQFPRPKRGLLSRPPLAEVRRYRQSVDERMSRLLQEESSERLEPLLAVIEIGCHHEQQHQELILTDIKHVFSCNPLYPAFADCSAEPPGSPPAHHWEPFEAGLYWTGSPGGEFAFDNEFPRHRTFLEAFELASRLTTQGEFQAFIEDGGYQRPELWLSEGWNQVQAEGWEAPLYWVREEAEWRQFTLAGLQPLRPLEPVCHVSLFEADAFARWAGARLPTEAEWEAAVGESSIEGNFAESRRFHPRRAENGRPPQSLSQMYGDVWEWSSSSYAPYPGYRPAEGALGEYNGKFMCNQYVLRGGSCATSRSHIRPTYRNFFPASSRWQFTGIRLAK